MKNPVHQAKMTPEEKNLLKIEAEKAKAQKKEQKLFKKLFKKANNK